MFTPLEEPFLIVQLHARQRNVFFHFFNFYIIYLQFRKTPQTVW